MTPTRIRAAARGGNRDDRGYAAVLVALLCPVVFIALAALSVDTARWYVEAERVQAAADAASLAGVVWMPADFDTAKTTALTAAKKNGYDDASSSVVVTVEPGEKPSQLKVTVSSTISNVFGSALGVPSTTVTRSAVADYAGGLSMGSPCNTFGADPDTTSVTTSTNCSNVGDFWANVAGPQSAKGSGDAFQAGKCAGEDNCTGATNNDYDSNGYIYTVTFAKALANLRVEVFDPSLVEVGDTCTSGNLSGAAALSPANTVVSDPATRYASGSASKYCTGDHAFDSSLSSSGFTNQVSTQYTVRYMTATSDPTRPWTWPDLNSLYPGVCPGAKTYPGYNGSLKTALDKSNAGYQPEVANYFRRWVTLCSAGFTAPQDLVIAVQVKTNGVGADSAAGHNRFAMRAYSASQPTNNDSISITAFNKMAVYANVPNGSSRFFLTRLPTSTAGQILTVKLFDIGDLGSGASGNIQFIAPTESGVTFSGCKATGKGQVNQPVSNCTITSDATSNGKWWTVYIPIPSTYHCNDGSETGCWVKLNYDFHGAPAPTDTTSWESSIDGQPVRLVQ